MNHLAEEKSPYLLQHKDNPVDWRPWGEEAFAEAKNLNKPVFLSIGYSTCHWCHVMAHESFENPEIARLMNENFVNIKVDREERPDVDRLYMAFVQATTGGGGWPMSVWLTPEGRPFYGGTYFPPDNRYGRAGFPNILGQIARLWREDRERVEAEAARVMEALAEAGRGAEECEILAGMRPLSCADSRVSPAALMKNMAALAARPNFPGPLCSIFSCALRRARMATKRAAPEQWLSSRCAKWPREECATISAAAFTGIRWTNFGTSRISRRCSTIRHSWRSHLRRPGN